MYLHTNDNAHSEFILTRESYSSLEYWPIMNMKSLSTSEGNKIFCIVECTTYYHVISKVDWKGNFWLKWNTQNYNVNFTSSPQDWYARKNDMQHEMPISLEKKSRLLLNNRSFDYCLEQTFSYDPWGNLTYRDPLFLEVQLFVSNRLLIENINIIPMGSSINDAINFFWPFWDFTTINTSFKKSMSPNFKPKYASSIFPQFLTPFPFKNSNDICECPYSISFCSKSFVIFLFVSAR